MSKDIPQEAVTSKSADLEKVVSDKTLAVLVKKLPNEMTPERDLWPGIERAISQKIQENQVGQQRNIFVSGAWAASIALVVLLSWFTFSPEIKDNSGAALVNAQGDSGITQGQLVNFMQQSFKQQKQTLLASYGQPTTDKLPVAMQQELKQLADARASIKKALLTDENNVDLLNLLDFTQQQELKLLQQLYRQYQVI